MERAQLKAQEHGVYSQRGEDGVLASIFQQIGATNRFFVEFGAKDGRALSNTANLRLHHGWQGLLMEGDPSWQGEGVTHEFVTAENIDTLCERHGVPPIFDLLSIDVDGNEYWIWKGLERFTPRVVVVEYNIFFGIHVSKTVPYAPDFVWDGESTYHGASLAALEKLGRAKGYTLVYTETWTPNAFFVRNVDLPASFRPVSLEEHTVWRLAEEPPAGGDRRWIDV